MTLYVIVFIGGDKMTYTLEETAKMFKVSIRTIQRWIKEGKIKKINTMGAVRISQKEIDRKMGGE